MGHIYKISNIIDERVYIGGSINLNERWKEHRRKLLNNKHENIHLQRFTNKYGIDSLIFDILEVVPNDIILIREQYYLDNTENKFNICSDAKAPMTGRKHSDESLKKYRIIVKVLIIQCLGKKDQNGLLIN